MEKTFKIDTTPKGYMEAAIHDVECCECNEIHGDLIEQVKSRMPDEDNLYDLAELFKVFGDSTRIRILYVLFESEMCVCDIVSEMGMTQSAVSHQLNQLRRSRLVRARREGRAVYYSLDDSHVLDILACGIRHLTE